MIRLIKRTPPVRTNRNRYKTLIIFVLLSLSLAACDLEKPPTQVPAPPTTSAPTATATSTPKSMTELPSIITSSPASYLILPSYLWDGLEAYWNLDGQGNDGTWPDITGHSHTLMQMHQPTSMHGIIGNAVSLVGSQGQFLEQANSTLKVNSDFTWAGWIYPTSITDNYIISRYQAGKGALLSARSGRIRFWVYGSENEDQLESDIINMTTWHFACARYNSSSREIFLQLDAKEISKALDFAIEDPGGPVGIGVNTAWREGFWDGYIDEFGWWNRTLTAEECMDLFNDGMGRTLTSTLPPAATATPTPTRTATPVEATKVVQCPGAPKSALKINVWAMVSKDPPLPNRIRSQPGSNGDYIGLIQPGEKVLVMDGPHCADGYTWWFVRNPGGLEGWTAEGDSKAYWLVPLHPESVDSGPVQNAITLTAGQIESAVDIEAAIKRATEAGVRPGTVILDGQEGPFVFTGDDRSLNIFVSNLTLRGVNQAVVKNCGDGLFFDDFPLKNILVEGIEFICEGDGVAASGAFENVTLYNNIFRAGRNGIGLGGASSDWLITENIIESGWGGIEITGAQNIVIANNHISGNNGVTLRECSQSQVHQNVIQASYQGVLLLQESWKNLVRMNTILGVSHSGIVLEPGVTGNQILANKVSCAVGTGCLTVDATTEVAGMNTINPASEENIAYSNDFENSAGREWSHHKLEISPVGRKFLGQFGNDTVILNLNNLVDHTKIKIVFELYLIRSWDGNINPDIWQLEVDGQSLLLTTFDNQDFYSDHSQAYPGNYKEGSNPPRTGAKENNTLGYFFSNRQMDAIYLLGFTIPHSSDSLELTFSANGLMSDLSDEGWGIDNVAIYTIK